MSALAELIEAALELAAMEDARADAADPEPTGIDWDFVPEPIRLDEWIEAVEW